MAETTVYRPATAVVGVVVGFTSVFLPFLALCFLAERQDVLPAACDPFGYLQLADAFANGTALGVHTERPFDAQLIPYLAAQGHRTADWALMIAPHAYHYDVHAGHVVNQYPPATSWLLSWFPKAWRFAVFPSLCVLLLVVPLLATLWWGSSSRDRGFHLATVLLVALACMFTPPLASGLESVTSTGPTYGLLIAAGFLLRRHPGAALALLGVTTGFRLGNVVLAAPLLAWYLWQRCAAIADQGEWRATARLAGRWSLRGGALFGAGFSVYLGYVWLQLGSPLRPTYTSRDTVWSNLEGVVHHIEYYFHSQAGWMWLHGVGLGLLWIAGLGDRRMLRWSLFGVALCAWNYAFYLLHGMPIAYYPYATALLTIGMTIDVVDGHPALALLRRQITALGALALLFILPLIRVPTLFVEQQFDDAVKVHQQTLGEFDVVWAGLKSGTAEYTTDAAGFRYFYGTPEVRIDTVRWLLTHGYRQAIWIDETKFDATTVERELTAAGIVFARRRTRLGAFLVVQVPAASGAEPPAAPTRSGR